MPELDSSERILTLPQGLDLIFQMPAFASQPRGDGSGTQAAEAAGQAEGQAAEQAAEAVDAGIFGSQSASTLLGLLTQRPLQSMPRPAAGSQRAAPPRAAAAARA